MTEEWRSIPSHEGQYEVSSLGRVRSLTRRIEYVDGRSYMREGQVLTAVLSGKPYYYVVLGRRDRRYIHQLVLESFSGPRPPNAVARHLDGDPLHNSSSNLAWGTQSENMHDRMKHGRDHYKARTHCKNGHEYTVENIYWTKRGARQCRACMAVYRTRYEQRKKTAA